MKEFFTTHFVQPILADSGYNLINSLTYGITAVILLYALFLLIKHLKLKINFQFLLSTVPFIFLGSSIRALVDAKYIPRGFWTISPGIYILVAGFFVFSLLLGKLLEKKLAWWKATSFIGLGGLVFLWVMHVGVRIENILVGLLSLISVLFVGGGLYFAFRWANLEWLTPKINFSTFWAHLFDAVNTAIILNFVGGYEKHPIPRAVINLTGTPFSFIFLKLGVIIPVIYFLNSIEDKEFKNYILIAAFVLGFAEALRNLMSLVLA